MRVHLVSLYVSLNKVFFVGIRKGFVRGDVWQLWKRHKLPFNPVSAMNKFQSTFAEFPIWKPLKLTHFSEFLSEQAL